MFSPQLLLYTLQRLPRVRRYWVAFSGGLDSTVLLHALAQVRDGLGGSLRALHIDHGLNSEAGAWDVHCREQCAGLGVPYRALRVDGRPGRGESPEAAARHARYGALARVIGAEDALLTAHHRDDQAETLLLQLLRGAGPNGLAAMPAQSVFGAGLLLRPLLGFSREELRVYAEARALVWVEDESNFDVGFDRNFLRHRVLPVLARRWPALTSTLSRAAMHQAEAARLNDTLAAMDLEAARGPRGTLRLGSLDQLGREDPARVRNLLRYWLRSQGLPVPSTKVLGRLLGELLPAPASAVPLVEWAGAQVRRYRGLVYAFPPLVKVDPGLSVEWDLRNPLSFAAGILTAERAKGEGIAARLCANGVIVRLRQGGERCRPAGRGHHHAIKKLLQEAGVPPWERDRMPFIYPRQIGRGEADQCPAQVVGLCVGAEVKARAGEEGVRIIYSPCAKSRPPAHPPRSAWLRWKGLLYQS